MKLHSVSCAVALAMATSGAGAVEQMPPAPVVHSPAPLSAPSQTATVARATTPEQQAIIAAISQRAEARWAALAKRDFAAAYAFETPGFRQLNDLTNFTGRFGGAVNWKGAQVTEVKLDAPGKVAKVALMLSYSTVLSDGNALYDGRRRIDETWIKVADQWWFAQSD